MKRHPAINRRDIQPLPIRNLKLVQLLVVSNCEVWLSIICVCKFTMHTELDLRTLMAVEVGDRQLQIKAIITVE